MWLECDLNLLNFYFECSTVGLQFGRRVLYYNTVVLFKYYYVNIQL